VGHECRLHWLHTLSTGRVKVEEKKQDQTEMTLKGTHGVNPKQALFH
jgi:hypothetical protein